MVQPSPFIFREEEKPRFKLRTASIFALLLLLLLFWGLEDARIFELSAEELALLEQQKQEQQRDMVFRFLEEPEDKDYEPRESRFLSDADRMKKSQQQETQVENDDPISIGNSLELEKAQQALQQQEAVAAVSPPLPEQKAEPTPEEQTPDEPAEPVEDKSQKAEEDIREHDFEPVEDATQHAERIVKEASGSVPTDPGAPKPFRKLSKSEREAVKQRAQQEMNSLSLRQAISQDNSFHNPNGSSAPFTGMSIETNRSDLGEYLKILKQLIRGNWRVPNIARYEVSGFAVVYFKIHKDGLFSDAVIVTESGYEPLDASSLNAIVNTYKAPPLPLFVEDEWVPIKFGFFYNMRPNY